MDKRSYQERKEYLAEWRNKNREKWNEYSQRDYATHKVERQTKHKEWQARNPLYEKLHRPDRKTWNRWQRAINKLIAYGVNGDDFERLLNQLDNGPCDSCTTKDDRMVIDHNHQTGKFRGILCHRCNVLIGLCDENPTILQRMIAWVNNEPLPPLEEVLR